MLGTAAAQQVGGGGQFVIVLSEEGPVAGCPTSRNGRQVDESSAGKGLDDHSGASYRSRQPAAEHPMAGGEEPCPESTESLRERAEGYRSAVPRAMTRPAHNLTGT